MYNVTFIEQIRTKETLEPNNECTQSFLEEETRKYTQMYNLYIKG